MGKKSLQVVSISKHFEHDLVFTGSKDGLLTAFTYKNDTLIHTWAIDVNSRPRSIDYHDEKILLGLKNGSIIEIPMTKDGNGVIREVMASHCDGEVWGLELINTPQGTRLITSCDDNRILCYDIGSHVKLAEGKIGEKKGAKKSRRPGASSMSSMPAKC